METLVESHPVKRSVPWGALQAVLAGLMSIGVLIVAAAVIAIGMALVWLQQGLGDLNMTLLYQLVFSLEVLLLIPPWVLGPLRYHLPWSVLGFRRTSWARGLAVILAGLGLSLLIDAGWSALAARLDLELVEQPDPLPYFGGGVRGLALALLLGAVVAPIAEETLFRGYVYPGLRKSWGQAWGLVVSAAVFALLHGFSAVIPPIFALGLILALAYDLTDSLWPPIAIHAGINALAFVSSYLASGGAQVVEF